MPKEPVSLESTRASLKNKTFTANEVGFIHTFMEKEEPIMWSDKMEDTSKMYKDFVADRKMLTLHFVNDSSVELAEEKKKFSAAYTLENDTSRVQLLKISYPDTEFNMPESGEPTMVTYTYRIRGVDDNNILLETPRSYNDQKVVLMMKKEK